MFLYVQAIETIGIRRLRPNMISMMGDAQAGTLDTAARDGWHDTMSRPRVTAPSDRWYRENTRESIRDETIGSLVKLGAVQEDATLPPTSPRPRYQLAADFADLFDPQLSEDELLTLTQRWQEAHLSAAARARVHLVRQFGPATDETQVALPTGESRVLPSGPSTLLTKMTAERLLPRAFKQPVVLSLAEGRTRIHFEDAQLLKNLHLALDPRITPDVLAADLNWQSSGGLALIAIELVASAGPMSQQRLQELARWLSLRGHGSTPLVAGTVFSDRQNQAARQWTPQVAWGTFVWYASEPDFVLLRVPGLNQSSLAGLALTAEGILTR
ncbi:MAG: hypothetical protein EXR52_08180 [Dehalococcoidia bacterium]|nr:hypothetical protein [Dehalococcoidia bacterium]